MRIALHGVHYRSRNWQLDLLYRMRNPWHLDNECEQCRFDETNKTITAHIGNPTSILEVGCGEGYQSEFLLKICDRLVGIDVNARAVMRAKEKCPKGIFKACELSQLELPEDFNHFRLVTACEVLYYMRDVSAALTRMCELGDWCLVTYYETHGDKLDPYFQDMDGVNSRVIRYNEISWRILWWRNEIGTSF